MVCSAISKRQPIAVVPSLGTINVVYGAHDINMDLAGFTVEEIQFSLQNVLNVGMEADVYVDGRLASPSYRVQPGQRVEFMKDRGRKAVGKTWTKTEFMQVFKMAEADWEDWVAKGLPCDTTRDGTIVINETEVDEWKTLQRHQKADDEFDQPRRNRAAGTGGRLQFDCSRYL